MKRKRGSNKGRSKKQPLQSLDAAIMAEDKYNKQELEASLEVIKKIMKMDAAEPFIVPVDPIGLGIPDYFDVIHTPMDFGTIRNNLEGGIKYMDSEDVYKDVQFIWDNCYKYNNKGDYIVDLMKRVKKNFMKYWMAAGLYTEQTKKTAGDESSRVDEAATSGHGKKLKKGKGVKRHKDDCLCAVCIMKRRRRECEAREALLALEAGGQIASPCMKLPKIGLHEDYNLEASLRITMDIVQQLEEEVEDDIMDDRSKQDEGEEQLDDVDRALASMRAAENVPDEIIVKGRGRSKGVKKNELMHLEYNELGQPDGKWSGEYGKYLGSCVLRIGINVRTYITFDVEKKLQFWEEAKQMFHIVDCPKKKKERLFHSGIAKRFRDFKSKLVRRWITKRTKSLKYNAHLQPWEVYEDFISKEEWAAFVEYYHSPEAKDRSEKARKCAMQNKHKQRTGQQGYNRKRPIWIEEGRLPPEAASSLSGDSTIGDSWNTSRIKYRPVEWRLAHEIRTPDGKWQIDPRDKETAEVAQKTVEFLNQQEQGLLEVNWGEDALTKAMGKKDHRGRVIGMGGFNVGFKTAFGPSDRTRSSTNDPSPEVVERIKESVRKEFEESFGARVAAEVQKYIASIKIDTSSSKHSEMVDTRMQELSELHIETPPRVLQVPTSCRLAVNDMYYGNQLIVADGLAYPTPARVTHSVPMLKNHYRVSVDTIYSGHEDVDLPVHTGEGKTKLRDAHLTFVQWPCNLVFFEEEITSSPKKKIEYKSSTTKEKVDSSAKPKSMQSHNVRKALLLDVDLQKLGSEFASIHSLMSCAPPGRYDNFTMTLDAALWHFDEDSSSNISATHLYEFLRGECARIPIMQVYIMFLVHEYTHILDMSQVIFLCPFKLSEPELKRDNYGAIMYVKKVFDGQIKGEAEAQCKFILVPYLEKNHWTLYAIDLRMGLVFEFDSNLSENRTNKPELRGCLNIGYQAYRFRGGVCKKKNRTTLMFIQMKCPQQQSALDCVYYVMKFMHEIVTLHNECKGILHKVYQERTVAYTSEELGEIREQWAMFFRNKYMLG